jgi:hypothetical protein
VNLVVYAEYFVPPPVLVVPAVVVVVVVAVLMAMAHRTLKNESFVNLEASMLRLEYQVVGLELFDPMMTTESLFSMRVPDSR